jgi:hypothetical protein
MERLTCKCMRVDCPYPHAADVQVTDPLEYGAIVPGITCPECGGELLYTSIGALCEPCSSYVPVVGTAVILDVEAGDDSDWTDDD